MYLKVFRNSEDKWVREDTGDVVGENLFSVLDGLLYKGIIKIPVYGYLDDNGSFIELCSSTNCSVECLGERRARCRYTLKSEGKEGFFIIDD